LRILLRLVSGLVVLAAALAVLAPAALLDAPLAAHTGDRLHLVDPSGVWWHGEGAVASSDGAARVPLAWDVAFAPLLTGRFVVALRAFDGAATPTGTVAFADGTIGVRDLHVVVPAGLVPALAPAVKAMALQGDIELHAPSFTWRGTTGSRSGTVDATWVHARVIAGPWAVDLGRVIAKGAPAGDGIAGTVQASGGDVTIEGTFDTRAGATSASLELTPAPGASEAVRAMLPLLGPVDQAGRVAIAWRSDRR
jgi:hypothetical protein